MPHCRQASSSHASCLSADLNFDERLSNGKPWLINIYAHYVRLS